MFALKILNCGSETEFNKAREEIRCLEMFSMGSSLGKSNNSSKESSIAPSLVGAANPNANLSGTGKSSKRISTVPESDSGGTLTDTTTNKYVSALIDYQFVFSQTTTDVPTENSKADLSASTDNDSSSSVVVKFPGNPGVALILLEYANGGSLASYVKSLGRIQLRA